MNGASALTLRGPLAGGEAGLRRDLPASRAEGEAKVMTAISVTLTNLNSATLDRSVQRGTDRSFIHRIMQSAHGWFQHKPSVELAEIVGCDVRTANRYFAGERTPDASALIALLRSPYGVRLVQEATKTLPAREHAEFWQEMAMAALRAAHREKLGTD